MFTLKLIFSVQFCTCFRYGEDSIELGNELVKMVGVAEALVDVEQQGLHFESQTYSKRSFLPAAISSMQLNLLLEIFCQYRCLFSNFPFYHGCYKKPIEISTYCVVCG